MSKIGKLFKNKKFLTGISIGAAGVIAVSSTLGIMLPSYYSWKEYYDAAIADREYNKYLQTLPLDILGLSAELNDNVAYYDNGKASPQKSDFNVVAHFTEKGRDFDEILQPAAFEIDVPENFASDGGTVKISYTFMPPVQESEEEDAEDETEAPTESAEPKVVTADVECDLSDVLPVNVSLKQNPYRVYYSDDMAFDTDGMTATVDFNDGHTETVGSEEMSASADKLEAGTESVNVVWSRGGTEMPFDVPVQVVTKADYKDGDIFALATEGICYIAEGAKTSEAKPKVLAMYFNGNRLPLRDDQYNIVGNVETAHYTQKCILNVLLKTDASIFTRIAAVVRTGVEAEVASFTGSKTEETHGEATVVVPQKGAVMTVGLDSDAVAKPELTMRVSLKGEGSLDIADVVKMTVNDKAVTVASKTVPAGDGFYDVTLPAPVLRDGSNTVAFEFYGDAASRLMIDRIDLEAGYKGEFYASTEQYLTVTAANGVKATFNNEMSKSWDLVGGKKYGHGICSDGTYMYIVCTDWANTGVGRAANVIKYDPVTQREVCKSADTDKSVLETNAGVTYYDGKIIIYFMDGRRMYVPVDEFTEGCTFKQYDGFDFEDLEKAVLKDVYYNPSKQKFAVFSGDNIFIYNKNKELINSFSIAEGKETSHRMTGSADYIYVNYTSDGRFSPLVHVYDWNGEHMGSQTIPVSAEFLTQNGVNKTVNTNVQGLAVINGDYYATFLRWGQGNDTQGQKIQDSCCMFKISMRMLSKRLIPELDVDEYLSACVDADVDAKFTAIPSTGSYGEIDKTMGHAMGGASDGEYLYVANNRSGYVGAVISQVNLSDYKVEAVSARFDVASDVSNCDNSRLFIKDGTLYCVAGDVFSVKLSEFANGCKLEKDETMTALLSQNGKYVLKSVGYDKTAGRYAVLTNDGKLYILDESGAQQGELISPVYSGMSVSSVACDSVCVYVSYVNKGQATLPIDAYSWTGDKLKTAQITGIDHGTYGSNKKYSYDIQAVYFVNGALHASVRTWGGSECRPAMFYDWTAAPDMSVFVRINSVKDYFEECDSERVAPKFTSKPTTGEIGKIEGSPQNYSMGAAQYGEYMFIASSNDNNASTLISKVRLSDYTVVAKSKWLDLSELSVAGRDNSRLFIKDDKLYCVAGKVYSIEISNFGADCELTLDETMTALLSQSGKYVLNSAYYNANADKYVVLTDQGKKVTSKFYVLNGDGSVAVNEMLYTYDDHVTSSIYGDDGYFYLSFKKDGQTVLPIEVFTWSGEHVYSVSVAGINLANKADTRYNIQAIYIIDGKLHASVSSWINNYKYFNDYTIEWDMSVFNQ